MRTLLIAILLLLLTLVLAGAFSQRHALACEALAALDYPYLGDGVFIAPDLSHQQGQRAKAMIDAAEARIAQVYGEPKSTPRLVFTSEPDVAEQWGANQTATMHRLPWGACIVVGPKGHSVDVIAHEWLHAEIQHRIGFLRTLTEMPTWFEEGASVTLDYRAPFLPENIEVSRAEVERVTTLTNGRAFYTAGVHSHYQAARMAVVPLIDPKRFFDDLDRIGVGERFEDVFGSAGRRGR
ncbi:hypothetical protein KUV89_03250 [Marinobacter hydrocarbonoclasticus]|nr:hypothetical protein [Marinobacter nauticus]